MIALRKAFFMKEFLLARKFFFFIEHDNLVFSKIPLQNYCILSQ